MDTNTNTNDKSNKPSQQSIPNYKDKYLKYKTKYLNEKMKGGQLSCVSNKYRFGNNVNKSAYFDIFFIAHELFRVNYRPVLKPVTSIGAKGVETQESKAFKHMLKTNPTIDYYVKNSFTLFDYIIDIYKRYDVRKELVGAQHMYAKYDTIKYSDTYDNYISKCNDIIYESNSKRTKTRSNMDMNKNTHQYSELESDRENCNIRKFNADTGMILSSNDILNLCREKFFNSTLRLTDPPDNQLGLIESVLGNLMNIGCNTQSLNDFIHDIKHAHTTEIIDFQNIASILFEHYKRTHPTVSDQECHAHALEQIVRYTHERIHNNENYVIIVFKPSQHYQSADGYGSRTDDDYIKSMFFGYDMRGTTPTFKPYSHTNQDMYGTLGQLLNSRLFFINMSCSQRSSSNYDDYIFWAITIGFYGLYNTHSHTYINNLKIITNDKQMMNDTTNTKNILNFNMCNFTHISHKQYYYENSYDKGDFYRINTYLSTNTVLKFYLEILHCVLNYDYLRNYALLSDLTTENINQIVESHVDGSYGLMDAISMGETQNYLVYTYTNPNTAVYSRYLVGYMFFALIKYIQWGQFGEEYGSLQQDRVIELFEF